MLVIYSILMTFFFLNKNKENLELKESLYTFQHTEAPKITSTFYAQIEKIDTENNELIVKGLDFDTTHKGKYRIIISPETILIGNGLSSGSNIIKVTNLKESNYISIEYSGAIKVDTINVISDVSKIQLLEDEKNDNENMDKSAGYVSIRVLKNTISTQKLDIIIVDNNKLKYNWGAGFKIQKREGNQWNDLKPIKDLSFEDIAYQLDENNQLRQTINFQEYYGTLETGVYRVVKSVYDKGNIDIYSDEFEMYTL